MLTDRGLGELRAAATLTHSVPGLRARIRAGGEVVAEVRRGHVDPALRAPGTPLVLSPCGFRAAVGQAVQHHRDGRQLQFLDLPEGTDPDVELSPASGDSRPGGLFGARLEECRIWAFATSLSENCQVTAPQKLRMPERWSQNA